jgi:membrane protein DedA with SNARE-associated domain
MPLVPFVVFTVLGSIPWNLALVMAGYLLGENWAAFEMLLAQYEAIILVALAAVAGAWVWLRFIRPRPAGAESAS